MRAGRLVSLGEETEPPVLRSRMFVAETPFGNSPDMKHFGAKSRPAKPPDDSRQHFRAFGSGTEFIFAA